MRFRVICSDPPWAFSDKLEKMRDGTHRGAESQYSTLTATQVANLRVSELADPTGCILALWVPSVLLPEGLRVMKAWGFNFKQTFIWVKTKKPKKLASKKLVTTQVVEDPNGILAFGMGRLFRQTHEIALIGTNNNGIYKWLKNKSQRSVLLDHNQGHSIKPEGLQDRLELMFPNGDVPVEKLEMFARRARPGWTSVGNGVVDEDIHVSIDRLIGTQESKITNGEI